MHVNSRFWKEYLVVQLNQIKLCSACFQLHLILSDPLTYNVVLDKLLIAQKDLLPSQDGGLRPGVKGSGARVRGRQHLLLRGFGYTGDHLVGGLQRWKNQSGRVYLHSCNKDDLSSINRCCLSSLNVS